MKLTATAIKNAKPKEKSYKLFDGGGLYLEVMKTGAKYWRLKYRIAGKEKRLAIGVYPEISLKQARKEREKAKQLLFEGIDPSEHKQAVKRMLNDSFEYVARDWHERYKANWTEDHGNRILTRLEKDVFPCLGNRQIGTITAPEVLTVLRRIESRGALDTAHRAMQNCSQVFRYAVATGKAERDPVQDLKGALAPAKTKNFSSITEPQKIGELLRAIDGYNGFFITKCALRLAPLVFVRPSELRQMEWSEISDTRWKIPAEKMKMRNIHIVPLSRQAVGILEEIRPLTGQGRYVFPGVRTNQNPLSKNALNDALTRCGYAEMTAHGFRSMASTLLHEQGFNSDYIERQLAHLDPNVSRRTYDYAKYLPERQEMMQAWADYLDGLKNGAQIVLFRQSLRGKL